MISLPHHHHRLRLLTLAGACAVFALTGCKGNSTDDDALNSAIVAKLHGDPALASEAVQATVKAGVATLDGTVSNQAARALAANEVAQVPGIRTVVNNLSVGPAVAIAAPAPAPAETVSTPPPAPVPVIKARSAASANRRLASAPVERQPPPAPFQAAVPPPPAPPPQVARNVAPPPPPVPAFRDLTLPAGTAIPIRMTTGLDSATTQQGDNFSGTVSSDVVIDGLVAIPQGSTASGRVDTVQEAAHFKGNSLLAIELTSVTRHGDRVTVATDTFSKAGEGRGKNTAEKVGGGAAVGAILGGIFGGGRGAAIGAGVGGGAGAGANTITRGQQVQIPSETLVRFKLTAPLTVRVRTSPAGRDGDIRPNGDGGADRGTDSGPRRPLQPFQPTQ